MEKVDVNELIRRAKRKENIISNDTDYYVCMGIIQKMIVLTRKGDKSITTLLSAKADKVLKNKFRHAKQREKAYYFNDKWMGRMLDSILEYEPTDNMKWDDWTILMTVGYAASQR